MVSNKVHRGQRGKRPERLNKSNHSMNIGKLFHCLFSFALWFPRVYFCFNPYVTNPPETASCLVYNCVSFDRTCTWKAEHVHEGEKI